MPRAYATRTLQSRWISSGFSFLRFENAQKLLYCLPVFRVAAAVSVRAQRRRAVYSGNVRDKLDFLLRRRSGQDGLGPRDLFAVLRRSHEDWYGDFGGGGMHGARIIQILVRRKSEHARGLPG